MNLDVNFFAKLSMAAYKSEMGIIETLLHLDFDLDNIKVIDAVGCRCFIARDRRKVFISFRGSDNIRNWLANFDYKKVKGVHGGFWKTANSLYNKIQKYIGVNDEIYLTGHSLGASLSLIIGNLLYEDLKYVKSVIVFESPNIAESTYIDNTQKYRIKRIHIRNNVDIVTHIPPTTMGFTNYKFNNVIYFNWKDKAILNPSTVYIAIDKVKTLLKKSRWNELTEDHLMDNILSLILKNKDIIERIGEIGK